MAFLLTDEQQVSLSVEFRSAGGNPARVDGMPEWMSSDESILTVAPAADGMSCIVSAVGPAGFAQVTVMADADLGDGVREISGMFEIEVQGAAAAAVVLTPGEPTIKGGTEPAPAEPTEPAQPGTEPPEPLP